MEQELVSLLNRYSAENGSDTPDFILATYLLACLAAFDVAVRKRARWYSENAVASAPPDMPEPLEAI